MKTSQETKTIKLDTIVAIASPHGLGGIAVITAIPVIFLAH